MWIRPATLAASTSSQDADLDREVLFATLEEVSNSWLVETTAKEINATHGDQWTPSRHFGVRQSGKVRNADDFSASLVNTAFGVRERIILGGIDAVAAAAKLMVIAGTTTSVVCLPLSDGSHLKGEAHPSLRAKWRRRLVGGTLDLAAAYKQLAVSPADAGLAVIARRDPSSRSVRLFKATALGASVKSSST